MKMSIKMSLPTGQTMFWLFTFFGQSLLTTPFASTVHSLEGPTTVSTTSDLENPDSTNRIQLLCHMKCQKRQCWNQCRGQDEEDSRRSREQIRRRKRDSMTENSEESHLSSANLFASTVSLPITEDTFSGSSDVPFSGPTVYDSNRKRNQVKMTAIAHSSRKIGNTTASFRNVTVTIGNHESGELFGDLQFWLSSSEDAPNQTFQLHMGSDTCNYDSRFPLCREPNHVRSYKIFAEANRWNKYRLDGLLFNAEYWMELEHGKERFVMHRFITPGCGGTLRRKEGDVVRCPSGIGLIPTTRAPHQSLLVQVVCVVYSGSGDVVSVEIRWPVDQPDERWVTSVLVLQMPDSNVVMTKTTERQEIKLDLTINSKYRILVSAWQGNRKYIVYHELPLNTSAETLKGREEQPECSPTPDPMITRNENSHGVLLGALVFLSLLTAGIVFLVHRKCKGKHIRMIGRRRSNSYKSSPSGQPLNPIDEWEIDPREVALGVEIGQGAFGRVLTGYYRDREVAIKIMKDNIPELHRDDLLREIALMKGLGFHPNIVTMLGACTIREPIALIVEYMPFGNLQSFLKKCRIDREMEVPEKRNEVLYCLLDEMTGVKESWQITPTDIMSFARQVVLAMQYLAERHYVHRDLAARNVLLGNGKVVKVCDFGLARLVYTGDQYFKLTSGRLPLKWMALESIRDRVFTVYSDVWSFGVLLWEMVTLGASPYPGVALVDLYRLLSEGYRMHQPANCSDELYDIMSQCWCENATDRPNFTHIRGQLENLLAKNVDYLDLDNIGICLEHSDKTEDSESKDRRLTPQEDISFF